MARTRRTIDADELKAGALAYLRREGLAALTFRRLAQALGVQPNTLEYHFGRKEQLVAALLAAVREGEQGRLMGLLNSEPPTRDLGTSIIRAWQHLGDPSVTDINQLFLEIVAVAARDPDTYADFRGHAMRTWLGLMTEVLITRGGLSMDQALPIAHLILATLRGLVLDQALMDSDDDHILDQAATLMGKLVDDHLRELTEGPKT